jgi:hypothetical protein
MNIEAEFAALRAHIDTQSTRIQRLEHELGYASLQRERVSFPTAPPSTALPPDRPSQPVVEALGRQFNPWHFNHPLTGKPLPIPASSLNPHAAKREPQP